MDDLVLAAATPEDTRAIGAAIAATLRPRDALLLTGELGAGKTTLVQGLASGLGVEEHVASPTFTLIREYTGRLAVAHVDVYRLDRVQDVVDLALDEIADGDAVVVVEWGDAIDELLADDRLRIELTTIDPSGDDETRRIVIHPQGRAWGERWDALVDALSPWKDAR
ncbi:MAG TPA: tRNA (adenosine(37)-N6)-threonylcarbamoyltransferase complex ATPase subunit type 1 TsaE [Actinomycetota bacterium]|nr:tRNA (adenosine(37)-N6)-threonylcarbamoyltransferase complex ATPase subunit type 1 TsaE [Actinomycetota bacterium]